MDSKGLKGLKPYLMVLFVPLGSAGLAIIAKSALNNGMSHYTFSVYRNVVALIVFAPFALVFERKTRPRMSFSVLYKIILLGLLEPVIDQNLYYGGMGYTSATFTTAMCNVLPAITFLLAWILRLEKVDMRKVHSQAKFVGTLATFGGAMIMTLVRGPVIGLPWTSTEADTEYNDSYDVDESQENHIKGALMIAAGCFCWSMFYILQAITLKSYPAVLSLMGMVCMAGAVQGTVLTLAVEWGNCSIWALQWDRRLLSYVYGGVVCSGISYYISGVVIKEKGPVFVTSFSPLNMVTVAVISSIFLSEQLPVGKVIGAFVIVVGLYLVIWGKSKDHEIGQPPQIKSQQDESPSANLV